MTVRRIELEEDSEAPDWLEVLFFYSQSGAAKLALPTVCSCVNDFRKVTVRRIELEEDSEASDWLEVLFF